MALDTTIPKLRLRLPPTARIFSHTHPSRVLNPSERRSLSPSGPALYWLA